MTIKNINSIFLIIFLTAAINAQNIKTQNINLGNFDDLVPLDVQVEKAEFLGQACIKVSKVTNKGYDEIPHSLVLLPNIEFTNGTIELELAAIPDPKAVESSRGFVGLAFHLDKENPESYECIYLRPTNGRADDQLRRNHSVQYVSHPEYPWYRLRKESPGFYESYVDLVPGEWTKVKIEVEGNKAKLYVHGNEQPTLIVNDLKKEGRGGIIGLWLHSTTIAYFSDLRITQ